MAAKSTTEQPKPGNAWFRLTILASALATLLSGCVDGPFYEMKKLSPWHQREWKRDRELGPTYAQRLDELQLLDQQVAYMPPADQEKWGELLERLVTKDTSPEIRSRAALVIAKINTEHATRALNSASTDEVDKVRLSVCKAWGMRSDSKARDMLLSIATSDESPLVRQAAIGSLAKFDEPEVRTALATALDDKNPAIQHQAVLALRTMTGRDYGGDFEAWQKFVGGVDVPPPEPKSMTARVMGSLPWTK